MPLRIEDHLNKRRDSKREQSLARELRELIESERFEFIKPVLPENPILGLQLAASCISTKSYFEQLLNPGFRASGCQ